jgi:hypothetical protein
MKKCECKWYNRCKKLPGCIKTAQAGPVAAPRPYVRSGASSRGLASYDTETVIHTTHNNSDDLTTDVAVGFLLSRSDDVEMCQAPVYVAEPAYYSPPPAPAYEPQAHIPSYDPPSTSYSSSSSYESSSYSSSSDYGSSSSYDSGSSSSSSDW